MKTEEQIAFALKQAETGTRVGEVCRKTGISEATFYNGKKKFAGLVKLKVSDVAFGSSVPGADFANITV